MLLRAFLMANWCVFLAQWELAEALLLSVQRRHFVLGTHSADEKVLEIVGAGAGWYAAHPVEVNVHYPSVADSEPWARLSCVEVIIIYTSSKQTSDEATIARYEPRVHFLTGGLEQSYATVSITVPDAAFVNHTSIFYGFR